MGNDGICRTRTKPGAIVTIDEARENSEAVNGLYIDRKYPLLIDARDIKEMTQEARKHFAIHGRRTNITSFGVLIASPISRVIGNFFMGLNKPSVPARLFTSETEAIAWLIKYRVG